MVRDHRRSKVPSSPAVPTKLTCTLEERANVDSSEQSPRQPESQASADRLAGNAASTGTEPAAETGGARFARRAHRVRLYLYLVVAVALLVFLVALAVANTGHVRVSWVFGTASVSLVWLVLFSAILGLLLGVVIGALFRWRTRRPREPRPSPQRGSERR